MTSINLAFAVTQKADKLEATRLAEKDLRWWTTMITKAAARGERECNNFYHVNGILNGMLGFVWGRKRCSNEYAESLQSLLPKGQFIVKYAADMDGPLGIEVTW